MSRDKKNISEKIRHRIRKIVGPEPGGRVSTAELDRRLTVLESKRKRRDQELKWEVSPKRRLLLVISIYTVSFTYFYLTDASMPYLDALIPAAAYYLTTVGIRLERHRRYKKAKREE